MPISRDTDHLTERRRRATAAAAAALLLSVLAAGCGSSTYHRYGAAEVRQFTVACKRTLTKGYDRATGAALCRCVLRYMHQDVPREEFVTFTEALRTNDPNFEPTAAVSADLTVCGV